MQSKHWDMDISFQTLVSLNETCFVDRKYTTHWSDGCFENYCMYLRHPNSTEKTCMIGIAEDGFVYIGDGPYFGNLPCENTKDVIREMLAFRENILLQKQLNRGELI